MHASTEFGIGGAWLAEYTLTALGAGVVLFDAGGRASQWNKAGPELLGVTEEQLAGRSLDDAVLSIVCSELEPLTAATNPVYSVLGSGMPHFEVIIGTSSGPGGKKWRSLSLLPVFGIDHQPRAVLTTIVDVHDRYDARNSNAQWQILAHSLQRDSLAANLVFDRSGSILEWSEQVLQMTGRTVVDLIDCNIGDICDIDLDWVWEHVEDSSRPTVDGVTFLLNRGGEEVPVFGRFSQAEWPTYGSVIVAQLIDPSWFSVAEQTAGPASDTRVFEHVQVPLLMITEYGVIVDANARAASLLRQSKSDLVGQLAAEYLPSLSWPRLRSHITEARLGLQTVSLGTFAVVSADHEETEVVVSVTAMGDDSPSPYVLMQLSESSLVCSATLLADLHDA